MSLFALAEIPWTLVEACVADEYAEALEDWRDESLLNLHLLERTGQSMYQLHQLLRDFFAAKRSQMAEEEEMKRSFCQAISLFAHQISPESTVEEIQSASGAIPHLQIAAEKLTDSISDEDVIWIFTGLAHFYGSQGLDNLAAFWYETCLSATQTRFGETHIDVANSFNNLAELDCQKERYSHAEELHLKALRLRVKLSGDLHPAVAISLNNLAEVYHAQGRYSQAEQFHLRALELRLQHLDKLRRAFEVQLEKTSELHSDIAVTSIHIAASLNNLAALYVILKRYVEAEDFYQKALQILKQFLGELHPQIATSLNNLAEFYRSQECYSQAEPLYLQALQLRRQLHGKTHPAVAMSFNNLALLYASQGRYSEAEPLYLQALPILFERLGDDHLKAELTCQNFLGFLQQVMQAGETAQLSDHPVTQDLLRQMREGREE